MSVGVFLIMDLTLSIGPHLYLYLHLYENLCLLRSQFATESYHGSNVSRDIFCLLHYLAGIFTPPDNR
jgi:hypothetical protein